MHIVTASDDPYVTGVMVLIASAYHHNPQARFTLLDMGISEANRCRIAALAARLGCVIDTVAVPAQDMQDLFGNVAFKGHVSAAALLRLFIPALLPVEERVIYMDCDMVVLGPLAHLWNIPLDNALIAAVRDFGMAEDPEELSAVGIPAEEYVNSGLLVMNLPLWRGEGIAEQCRAFLMDDTTAHRFQDQSAINAICRGRIVYLPYEYNVFAHEFIFPFASPGDVSAEIKVLHYVGPIKTWQESRPFEALWWHHAGPIRDLLPARKKRPFRELIPSARGRVKYILGLAVLRPKYRAQFRQRQIAQRRIRAVHKRLIAPYLAKTKLV